VITGSTTESALADFFRSRGLSYEPVVVDRVEQARASYQRQACDALTDDISGWPPAARFWTTPRRT
jgi:general L-amino acid transport system substrate-binding protein